MLTSLISVTRFARPAHNHRRRLSGLCSLRTFQLLDSLALLTTVEGVYQAYAHFVHFNYSIRSPCSQPSKASIRPMLTLHISITRFARPAHNHRRRLSGLCSLRTFQLLDSLALLTTLKGVYQAYAHFAHFNYSIRSPCSQPSEASIRPMLTSHISITRFARPAHNHRRRLSGLCSLQSSLRLLQLPACSTRNPQTSVTDCQAVDQSHKYHWMT